MDELTRQAPYSFYNSEIKAEKKERSHKSPADQLLVYIYIRLKKRTHQPKDIMRKLSDAQKTMIIDALKVYFIAGRKCKDSFSLYLILIERRRL